MRILLMFFSCCIGACLSGGVAADTNGSAMMVVYPDYPINTDTFYGYARNAGHAGVLLINEQGLTKYFEFGRYDKDKIGVVRNITISNVEMKDKRPTVDSLKKVLGQLSKKSGKGGRIRAAWFIHMDFDAIEQVCHPENEQERC